VQAGGHVTVGEEREVADAGPVSPQERTRQTERTLLGGDPLRAWKVHLAKLAQETGLDITVSHYPPGTSKWNKIEHRMFGSFITMNWRGRPLTSLRTIIELISATTTTTGLTIQAADDPNWYPTGVKVTDAELAAVPLSPHEWHGDWNYTLRPTRDTPEPD
jgi:hypothetical protein